MFKSLRYVSFKKKYVFNTFSGCGADQTRLRLTHETSFVKLHTSFWTAIPFFFYVVKKLLFLSLPIASNVFLMLWFWIFWALCRGASSGSSLYLWEEQITWPCATDSSLWVSKSSTFPFSLLLQSWCVNIVVWSGSFSSGNKVQLPEIYQKISWGWFQVSSWNKVQHNPQT